MSVSARGRDPTRSEGTPWLSVSQLLVHYVPQRLPFVIALELLDEEAHRLIQPVRRVVGAMRREEHVLQPVERMTFGQRLAVEYVQRGALDMLAGKRRYQSRLLDHRAAADIDYHRVRFHRGELFGPD